MQCTTFDWFNAYGSQTTPAQQPQQSTSQPQPQPAQQVQQPLAQQQLQHQHTQISQLHQLQAQQQAIQSQRSAGASSALPNRSTTVRLSAAVNARPLSQQGQHLQQGRGVQVSVPLQAGSHTNIVSFPHPQCARYRLTNGLPQNSPSRIFLPNPKTIPIRFMDYHQILLKNRLTYFTLNYWSAINNQRSM